jgi:Concanavalin A-like lectin/glucanases superfamily/VanZ like family
MSFPQDRFEQRHKSDRVRLLAPFIVMVLAATAIPVELRRFDFAALSLQLNSLDVVANLAFYVPVGMALKRLGFWRAVILATLLSLFAELSQFFMAHRFPSPIDLALNVAGAVIGLLVSWIWRIHALEIRVNVWTALLSLLAALTIIGLKAWSDWERLSVSCRGAVLPGSLESNWTFDDAVGGIVSDASGVGLNGRLIQGAVLVNGIHGMAVNVDGQTGYVDFGRPVDLRLMGSMTISAWIKSTSFPIDDAAIVSAHRPGYQLDTTVDRGPRTLGFKLVDPCGNLMARYGATELVPDTWYHAAGVYDADARTLNVYLNGQLDDGFLLGSVTSVQQASNQRVCVGRRADTTGYEFAGLIDDVRIDSRALTKGEIEESMIGIKGGSVKDRQSAHALARKILARRFGDACHQPTSPEDALVPGLTVAVGVLSALACAGFWRGRRLSILVVSLGVGLLLALVASITLPPLLRWMLPVLSLAGGTSVAASLSRAGDRPQSLND